MAREASLFDQKSERDAVLAAFSPGGALSVREDLPDRIRPGWKEDRAGHLHRDVRRDALRDEEHDALGLRRSAARSSHLRAEEARKAYVCGAREGVERVDRRR